MAVNLKEFNLLMTSAGLPGTGKSYFTADFITKEARRVGAYVVCHDPTGSYDALDWKKFKGIRYASPEALKRGIKNDGGNAIHILDALDGVEVLKVGIEIAEKTMKRAENNKYNPVIVILDEAVGAAGTSAYRLGDEWLDAIARRRHLGIGLALTGQSAHFFHRALLALATRVEIFRLVDPADLSRLRAIGLTPELAQKVKVLPDRQHVTIMAGKAAIGHDPTTQGGLSGGTNKKSK